jgi:hypothetical protein
MAKQKVDLQKCFVVADINRELIIEYGFPSAKKLSDEQMQVLADRIANNLPFYQDVVIDEADVFFKELEEEKNGTDG